MTKGSSDPSGYVSVFDVDARAELCRLRNSAVPACPRIGEQVDYRAEIEQGGGLYLVVNVRHILEKSATRGGETTVAGTIVEVQPIHSTVAEQVASLSIDIPIAEPTVS